MVKVRGKARSVRTRAGRGAVLMEGLEPRWLLAAAYPTNNEQYMIELLNRARMDPAGEAARYGIDLNEGLAAGTISAEAKQPLAINVHLTDAAQGHSQWMLNNDVFAHTGANGSSPHQRMAAAGYTFTGFSGSGENIGWSGTSPSVPNQTNTTGYLHQALFVDAGIAGRGHRTNMLNANHKEVGVGILSGVYTYNSRNYNAVMISQEFAYNTPSTFITGVAYADTVTANNFYTPGEGLGGVTITATRASDGAVFRTTTFSSGGYSLPVSNGAYTVTASGGGLGSSITWGNVAVNGLNVKRDFVAGAAGGPPADTTAPTATLAAPGNVTVGGGTSKAFTITYADASGINTGTIGAGDVVVTRSGTTYQTSLAGTITNANGSVTATYTMAAPGGIWDDSDNGTYSVVMQASQVLDSNGNFVAAGTLGTFQANIVESTPPTASLVASNIVSAGGTTAQFTVTYSDAAGINNSTLGTGDVTVGGPKSFSQVATLVSINTSGNGSPRVATYSITASGGSWDAGDNGSYTVTLGAGQVADVNGNFAAGGALGAFAVNVPDTTAPAAALAVSDVASTGVAGVQLTITYTDDVSINASTIGTGDIRVTGPGGFVQLATLVSQTGSATGRIASYRVDAPGGAWGMGHNGQYSVALLAGQVSDGSGNMVPSGTLGTFTIAVPDVAPPAAAAEAADLVGPAAAIEFLVTYTDQSAIDLATLGDDDLRVSGPGGYLGMATLISIEASGQNATRATYRLSAPDQWWQAANNGTYTITLLAGTVADAAGNAVAGMDLAAFAVNIPDTTLPQVTATVADITVAGGVDHHVTVVTYTDDVAISVSSLDGADIRVRGPLGISMMASLHGVSSPDDGTPRMASYRIDAPGGMWDHTDNGQYIVEILDGRVLDTSGNAVAARVLATFNVEIEIPDLEPPTAVAAAGDIIAPGATSHTFTITYSDDIALAAGTIGLDAVMVMRDDGLAQQALFVGVEADEDGPARTARYVVEAPGGAWDASHNGLYSIEIISAGTADTSGKMVETGAIGNFEVNLPIPDVTPPERRLSAASVTRAGGKVYQFSVRYHDAGGVKASTLGRGNLVVTSSRGLSQVAKLIVTTSNSDGSVIIARYYIVPPGKSWAATDNGTYVISMRTAQVSDMPGNYVAAGKIGIFKVAIPRLTLLSRRMPAPAPAPTPAVAARPAGLSLARLFGQTQIALMEGAAKVLA